MCDRHVAEPALVECGAHIQGLGDVWGWPGEWVVESGGGRAIEAIAMEPTGVPRDAIAYRVVLDDGSLSGVSEGGAFSGSENKPLRGFEVRRCPTIRPSGPGVNSTPGHGNPGSDDGA